MKISSKTPKIRHGDTIVEVMISLAVFSAVAMATINMMNSGISMAQRSLEMTMARLAIDSQTNAIDFIHDAANAERQKGGERHKYLDVWNQMTDSSYLVADPGHLDINNYANCEEAITTNPKKFAINPRALRPAYDKREIYFGVYATEDANFNDAVVRENFTDGGSYPRIIYERPLSANSDLDTPLDQNTLVEDSQITFVKAAEIDNLWVSVARGESENYYDFYVQTCWHSAGAKNFVTFSTVKRIYDRGTL